MKWSTSGNLITATGTAPQGWTARLQVRGTDGVWRTRGFTQASAENRFAITADLLAYTRTTPVRIAFRGGGGDPNYIYSRTTKLFMGNTTVEVEWPKRLLVQKKQRINGTVGTAQAPIRVVLLQRWNGKRYVKVKKAFTDKDRGFSFVLPRDRANRVRYRVRVRKAGFHKAVNSKPAVLKSNGRKSVLRGSVTHRQVSLRGKVFVTGKVSATGPRRVVLQHRSGRGKVKLAATTTSKSGRFRMKVPTGYYGRRNLTIEAKRQGRFVAASRNLGKLNVTWPYPLRGPASAHNSYSDMRWNPCRTITWAVNKNQSQGQFVSASKYAMRHIAEATGFKFKFVGTSNHKPFLGQNPRSANADIVIAWAPSSRYQRFKTSTVGVGGLTSYRLEGKSFVITNGGVLLQSDYPLVRKYGNNGLRGLLLHEIGHVFGLDHVHASGQVMKQGLSGKPTRWGRGDLTLLHRLGLLSGCP